MRSPVSSGNDSEDSSDVDGVGNMSNTGKNEANSLTKVDIIKKNTLNTKNPHIMDCQSSANIQTISKQSSVTKRIYHDPKVIYPTEGLPNVTQNVLLQLIEAGHLQVHTEEDRSGHQYVDIPRSPTTAELIQSNKNTSALEHPEPNIGYKNVSKGDSHDINIKEELT